jgi:hypothetical protein
MCAADGADANAAFVFHHRGAARQQSFSAGTVGEQRRCLCSRRAIAMTALVIGRSCNLSLWVIAKNRLVVFWERNPNAKASLLHWTM